jgi:site-specific DNA recombinase
MANSALTIGYIRVSTAGQVETGVSLEAQAKKIRAYCDLHDLELQEIIEDAGLSGKSIAGRPGIQKVLDLVKTRKVANVIIFKLDRLARNLKEACEIAELFQKKDVALHSISEKIDSASATGRLFYNILSAMAAWEREIIGERTAVALSTKREKGERTNYQAPFGYRHESGRLVQDVNEQEILNAVAILKAEGHTVRAIVQLLAENGYTNRKGNSFGVSEVWRMSKKAA